MSSVEQVRYQYTPIRAQSFPRGRGPGLVTKCPRISILPGEAAANTELPSDENRFVSASYVGLLEIDRLADRQEASLFLLRNLNTAIGRAARHLHTILELNFPRGDLPGGRSPLGSSRSGYFHMIVLLHVTRLQLSIRGFCTRERREN